MALECGDSWLADAKNTHVEGGENSKYEALTFIKYETAFNVKGEIAKY